jgi:hypothetical protein
MAIKSKVSMTAEVEPVNDSSDVFQRPPMPPEAENTGTYAIANHIGVILNELELVPDILNGTRRPRHFGAYFGMHIVPDLDRAASLRGPIILPEPPAIFIDADDLDTLKARLYYEIDTIIDSAKKIKEQPQSNEKSNRPTLVT